MERTHLRPMIAMDLRLTATFTLGNSLLMLCTDWPEMVNGNILAVFQNPAKIRS